MKVKDIYDYIDSFAPFSSQSEWDNSGLLVGDFNADVTKIAFSLDCNIKAVKEAADIGCNLIITHHPVIFRPLRIIDEDSVITALIRNNINIICAHTNLDKSSEGVNYILAKKLGLQNLRRFDSDSDAGMCFIGETEETNTKNFAKTVSEILNATVEFTNAVKPIKTVAVCGGAGGEFIYELAGKADAFVSGEIKYHEFSDSENLGISAIKAGHYETESPAIPYLAEKIRSKFDTDCIILKQYSPTEFTGA